MSDRSQETINQQLTDKLEEIGNDIKDIKAQTTKTNGRVNALENWKWMITGGIAVITVLIVPLFLNLLK